MKRKILFKITFVSAFALLSVSVASAQSVKRQVIGSYGASGNVDGVSVHQTIGEPYNTTAHYDDKSGVRPGFQQPESFHISKGTSNLELDLFPNPAVNQFTINADEILETAALTVTDVTGKLIVNQRLNQIKSHTLDCSQWTGGIYFVTLNAEKQGLYTSKLIITK